MLKTEKECMMSRDYTIKEQVDDKLDQVKKQIIMFKHLICCNEAIHLPEDVGSGLFCSLQELADKVEMIAALVDKGLKDKA